MNELNREVNFITTQLDTRPVDSATKLDYVDSMKGRISKVVEKLKSLSATDISVKDNLLSKLQDRITTNNARLLNMYEDSITVISNARRDLATQPITPQQPQAPLAPPRLPRGFDEHLKKDGIDPAQLDKLNVIDFRDIYSIREKRWGHVPDDDRLPSDSPSCHTKPAFKNPRGDALEQEILEYLKQHPNHDDPLRKEMKGYIGMEENEMKKIFESACVSWAVSGCCGTPNCQKNPDWYVRHSDFFGLFNTDNIEELKKWDLFLNNTSQALQALRQNPKAMENILQNKVDSIGAKGTDASPEEMILLTQCIEAIEELTKDPPSLDKALDLITTWIAAGSRDTDDKKREFLHDIVFSAVQTKPTFEEYNLYIQHEQKILEILSSAMKEKSTDQFKQTFDTKTKSINKLEDLLFTNFLCGLNDNEKSKIRQHEKEINDLLSKATAAKNLNTIKDINKEVLKLYLKVLGYELADEGSSPYCICMIADKVETAAQDHWGVQISTDKGDHIFETLDFRPIGHKPKDWKAEYEKQDPIVVSVPVKTLRPEHLDILAKFIPFGIEVSA